MSSMASGNAYDCYHCGQRCGGRTPGGYGAITGTDGAIHASCSPDDPETRPDCYRRVTEFGEAAGALIGTDPKPTGITDIR
jgi:hypothetical protein